MAADLERAAAVLASAPEVALACHLHPDPDALGSMLGLRHVLDARGVRTVASVPDQPFVAPPWAAALPGADTLVPAERFPAAPAVMVTFDCASFDRLGVLRAAASAASELIWIDHHRSNVGVGTIALIDGAASSTCEMVMRVVDAMGAELDDDAAACLYAGLVTDTGRFQYEATTPETLRLAARLRERPFDHTRLVQALYEDNPGGFLTVTGVALRRLEHMPDADLVWTYVTQADLRGAGVHAGETDDLIDVIRTSREADVAVVLRQQADGRYKVSMRSKGAHDLAAAATVFGGGGHRLAAGYTSEHGPAGTIARLIEALRQNGRA